jgi:hypothetical protein
LGVLRERVRGLIFGVDRTSYLRRGVQKRVSSILYSIAKAFGRSLPQSVGTIEDINRFAAFHYFPGHYNGCLTLLRTELEREDMDSKLGWGRLASEVEVHEIPGGHYGITYEPHVQVLAARLSQCLDRRNRLTGQQSLVESDHPR